MSAILTRCRVSSEQLDLLLSFMEEHPDFAAGKQSIYSRFSASKLWRLLAERLNAAAADSGGARKSPDKWCRYWADIKYKARKKCAAAGALGDLSSAEERLQTLFSAPLSAPLSAPGAPLAAPSHYTTRGGAGGGGGGGGALAPSDEERKHTPAPPDDDMRSEGSAAGGERLAPDELLAEAAMRQALAAEKQAEAVAQAVDLLRELVTLVRDRLPPPAPAPAPAPHPLAHAHAELGLAHHHRL